MYFGTTLRALASQAEHQQGITEFAARLSAEVAQDPDYELLDLLPTHRSQITYQHGGRRYDLHPDTSLQLSYQGYWDWHLLKYERRAVTPKRVPERLRVYRRYFASDYPRRDHGGAAPLVLFLFETAEAAAAFLQTAARLRHAPLVSSNLPTLTEEGVLAPSWRLPLPHPAERVHLHAVRSVRTGSGQAADRSQTVIASGPSVSCRERPRHTTCPRTVQPATDRNVPLVSNDPILPGPLSAIVRQSMQLAELVQMVVGPLAEARISEIKRCSLAGPLRCLHSHAPGRQVNSVSFRYFRLSEGPRTTPTHSNTSEPIATVMTMPTNSCVGCILGSSACCQFRIQRPMNGVTIV